VSLKSFQYLQSGGGGAGTVTQINTAGPITGGPITSSGTINLAASGVTANTYGNASVIPVITVDTYGRITSATNVAVISGGTGTVTLISTDANLTGGPISTTGTLGLANVITIGAGNVTTTNANVGYAIVNINTLNAAVNGLNAQIPVQYATTANLSVTYNNGTLGAGANLTATTNGVLSIDGSSPTATQRILVKDQTANAQNGIYTVTVVGTAGTPFILTRATDYDTSSEMNAGDGFYVELGSANKNTTWVQQTPAPITVGTTAITFIQFGTTSTGLPKQPYTANTALYANSSTTLTLGVLPSAAGGTGLTTFTAANNAIYSTSASGLTAGTLPITAGGTGATTASTALNNLGGVSTGKAIAMAIVFGG